MATASQNKGVHPKKPLALWAITPNGSKLATKILLSEPKAQVFISRKLEGEGRPCYKNKGLDNKKAIVFDSLAREIHSRFNEFDRHVFIFSTGIAVRMIAPLIRSKLEDPAVVVVDDKGIHAISLLSGHIGGANILTQRVSSILGARPVVTTATDVGRLPAIDLIAKQKNLFIETPANIKQVGMAFLEGRKIGLYDPMDILRESIPESLIDNRPLDSKNFLVYCSWERKPVSRETMVLRPKVLSVGLGCNRNTPFETIHSFFRQTMTEHGLSTESVFSISTTEVKRNEPGLIQMSKALGVPIRFYDNTSLNSVKTIENPSEAAEKHLGVKSVCEAAAILTANNGKLILPKKKNQDVTLAVALKR